MPFDDTAPPVRPSGGDSRDAALAEEPDRTLARACGLAAVAVALALLAVRAAQRPAIDFAVFHRAGSRFMAGADLYAAAGDFPYRYAPGVAALFAPLALLPFATAKAVWAACSACTAFAAALILDRRVGRKAALAVPLAWACLAQPVAQELAHGQVDVLVLLLALAAFSFDDGDRELGAGALVAVSAALKVAPAILALDWLVRRRWRAFVGCAACGIGLIAVLLPWYGIAGAFQEHVRWSQTQSADVKAMIGTLGNQSAWALARSAGFGTAGGTVICVAIVALALSERSPWRRRCLLLGSVPLVSAYGWPQLFVLAVPLLSDTIASGGTWAWLAGTAAAAVSLASYDIAGPRVEGWAQGHRLLGLALLVVVVAGRFGSGRAGDTAGGARQQRQHLVEQERE